MRSIPPKCVALVKAAEGLRLTAYPDPATGEAPWTIGYGHTGPDVRAGLVITQTQAEQLLATDLAEAAAIVERAVTAPLTDSQFAALVSFVFNVGPGRRKAGKDAGKDGFVTLKTGKPSTLLIRLNAVDHAGAAAEFAKWTHGGGKVMAGLVKRRAAEAALFLSEAEREEVTRSAEPAPTMKPLAKSVSVQAGTGGLTLAGITVAAQQARDASGAVRGFLDTLPALPAISAGWLVAGVLAIAVSVMLYRRFDDHRKSVA